MNRFTNFMAFALFGCDLDRDGDGILNRDEIILGLDASNADTDGDGLTDFEEINIYNSNPLLMDSDGDGDPDGWEVEFGFDVLDSDSHGYELDWPIVPAETKQALSVGIAPALATVGMRLRRAFVYDSIKEAIDLYDMSGIPFIISFVARHNMVDVEDEPVVAWLFMPDDERVVSYLPSLWVRDAALAGQINLAVVLWNDPVPGPFLPSPPTLDDVRPYCDAVTSGIGCFADLSWELYDHLGHPTGTSWVLTDENMIVRSFASPDRELPEGVGYLDDLEQKLSIMLNIVPPVD